VDGNRAKPVVLDVIVTRDCFDRQPRLTGLLDVDLGGLVASA